MSPVNRDRRIAAAAGWLGLLTFMPILQVGLAVFDEGFISTGAMLIRRGWLPMRDFFVIYGPGQYYLSAALFSLFGEDLFVQRVASAVLLSVIGLGVAAMAARLGASRWGQGWVGLSYIAVNALFMPNPGYPAVLAVGLLLWAAVSLVDGLQENRRRQLVQASLLIGGAGLTRWDFGVFGLVAAGVVVFAHWRMRTRWMDGALVLMPALLLWLLLFVPFVLASGLERWWAEVPAFHSREFPLWRSRDVLRPAAWALQNAWAARDGWYLGETVTLLFAISLPVLLALLGLVVSGLRVWRGPSATSFDLLALGLSVLTLLLLNQVRVRSGLPQGMPAFYASLPLGPYLLQAMVSGRVRRIVMLLALSILLVPVCGAVRAWHEAIWQTEPVALARASHLRVDARRRVALEQYSAMLTYLNTCLPAGAPVFSGVQDTSRLFVNDAMVYFLADRLPATRWVEMEPGLTNTRSGQQDLIREVLSAGTGAVILWEKLSDEPNLTARSNGIHAADEAMRARFRESRRFGAYEVRLPADASAWTSSMDCGR